MRRLACGAAAISISIAAVACGGGTPTSPSQVTSVFSPLTSSRTVVGAAAVLSGSDTTFAASESNAIHNLIQLGQLAEQRGDKGVLKAFGRQLLQDYQEARDQLDELAGSGIVRAGTFDAADLTVFNSLRGLSGSAFDAAFVPAIIAELTSARTSFLAWSTSASSAEYRAHAAAMASLIARHLTMARDVETFF